MSNNLKEVKRKLTNRFTAIVFLLLLFLGVFFFSIKLFTFNTDGKRSIEHVLFSIIDNNSSIESFIMNGKRLDNSFGFRGKQVEDPIENDISKEFLNIIHLDKDNNELNVLIRDDVSNLDFQDIIENQDYINIKSVGGFLIARVDLKNKEKVILIKELKYGLKDYILDVLAFTLVISLFSAGLFYIGMKFVNKVMIPVEENISDMKDFVHNAGHELKTPISVIDSNLQLLGSMKIYDESMNNELKNETIKLNSLIDGLINLSDIDGFNKTENVNLLELFNDIINCFKSKLEEKNITVKIKIGKTITINTNKNNIYIALSNLVGNAIKYNNNGGKIDIIYRSGELNIKDTGIGIDKENIDKVFNRFFKEDKSRSTEGFGIGLSLVKKITNLYGWKIKVDSEVGKGTNINIFF